ncbi:DUF5592 family protein [Macrococcoides caseolyticum]|uniref:Uncharacterized protein n=1 Tax=Macrococcus caseolyticus (strain JCSC5402) TaxID=458233 RepID=B9EC73_MACCJ|nr:DUF5592 family protein [Macrococcus caseolyticus]BAH18681.1 conserved hypothetical protein [Macrococcus caseolyticus JCSC5402]
MSKNIGNQGYTIPRDMKADILIIGKTTLKDIIVIIIFVVLGFMLANFIDGGPILTTIIVIIQFLVGGIAIAKPKTNPDKPMYLVIASMFRMDKNVYRSLDYTKYIKKEMK